MKKCPFCAEEIQDEAVVCKHCGRDLNSPVAPKAKKKGVLNQPIGCGGGLLLLLLMGFCAVLVSDNPSTTPGGAPAAPAAAPQQATITMAKFQQLADGMSYRQVVQILGREGEEQSRSSIGGTTTVMYQWMNPGVMAGNMNAMFQSDRLISKAQFGLK